MSAGTIIQDILEVTPLPPSQSIIQHAGHVCRRNVAVGGLQTPPKATSRSRAARSGKSGDSRAKRNGGGTDGDDGGDDPRKPGSLLGDGALWPTLRPRDKDLLPDIRDRLESTGILKQRRQFADEKHSRIGEETITALKLAKQPKSKNIRVQPRNELSDKEWHDYLNSATYDEIDFHGKPLTGQIPSPSHKDTLTIGVLSQAFELGTLRRCIRFDRCCNPWAPAELGYPLCPQRRTLAIIARMQEYLMSNFESSSMGADDAFSRATSTLADLVSENPEDDFRVVLQPFLEVAAGYLIKDNMISRLTKKLIAWKEDLLGFEEWLVEIIGQKNFSEFARDYEFRRVMSRALRNSVPGELKAELFQNVGQEGIVTLGLFRGDVLPQNLWAVKDIPTGDLLSLGWDCEVLSTGQDRMCSTHYFRREKYEVSFPGHQFYVVSVRVSMDGEILGIEEMETCEA